MVLTNENPATASIPNSETPTKHEEHTMTPRETPKKPRRGTSPAGLYLTLTLAACAGCGESESTPSDADAAQPTPDAAQTPIPEGYVRIEPGEFTMGSPEDELGRFGDETQHRVTVTRAFALKATEVTQAEWRAVMGNNPSGFRNCGDTCPVERVSWFDAVDYVNRVSDAEGLPRCYADDADRTFAGLDCTGYRLPTEAEWEYAARAGAMTALHTGDIVNADCVPVDPNADAAGWYCGNAGGTPHPVGEKQPNAWGLYDMHGNVSEWVHDWWAEYPAGAAVDPAGPASGGGRVDRGGSWGDDAQRVRSADRAGFPPADRFSFLGFRPSRSLP
jgi:formylglycine-generating enzyme required for sulfatase activity